MGRKEDRARHKAQAQKKVTKAICLTERGALLLTDWRCGKITTRTHPDGLKPCGCCLWSGHTFWIVTFDEPQEMTHSLARLLAGEKPKLVREV